MISRQSFLKRVVATAALPIMGSTFALGKAVGNNQGKTVKPLLLEKLEEALYAFVIADAMGGPVENNLPAQTKEQFGHWDFTQFLPPMRKEDIEQKKGKGDGRTTDDALNMEALIGCYNRHQDHLDAYDYAEYFIKEITEEKVWIAERAAYMTPHDRPLWWPERYVYNRLVMNNIEPRYAGMGNWINEGFQGIVLPVGAVNAGDPWRAYDEATLFAMAHTESFGVESAGINAAGYAVAFQKDSSIDKVIEAIRMVAKDGTKLALEDVLSVTNPTDSLDEFVRKTREAVVPYLQLSPALLKQENLETPKRMREHTNIGRPSRIACIENVPIAIAALKYGQGDYLRTMKAGIFYGRDAESIAAVATSLLCAIRGKDIIPKNLKVQVDEVNKRDHAAIAAKFFGTIKIIYEKDSACLEKRKNVIQ